MSEVSMGTNPVFFPDIRIADLTRQEMEESARVNQFKLEYVQNLEQLRIKFASSVYDRLADELAIRDLQFILDTYEITEKKNYMKRRVIKTFFLIHPELYDQILWLMRDRATLNLARAKQLLNQNCNIQQSSSIKLLRLNNPNNLCYCNAAVNILLNSKPLRSVILADDIMNKIQDGRGDLILELRRLMKLPDGFLTSTSVIQSIISRFCREQNPGTERTFDIKRQWDAGEFLYALLDCLRQDFQSELTEFKEIFEGFQHQSDTCNSCSQHTVKVEPLPIINSFPVTGTNLADCINFSYQPKIVEKQCNQCSGHTCMRQEKIKKFPQVLFLDIQRYSFNLVTNSVVTSDLPVKIPTTLVLFGQSYSLQGFITHIGMDDAGHYTATILDDNSATYTKFNDTELTQNIKEIDCKSEKGYVFCFQKKQKVFCQDDEMFGKKATDLYSNVPWERVAPDPDCNGQDCEEVEMPNDSSARTTPREILNDQNLKCPIKDKLKQHNEENRFVVDKISTGVFLQPGDFIEQTTSAVAIRGSVEVTHNY